MGELETRAKRDKIGAALSRQSSPATNLVSSLQRYAGNRAVQELLANRKPAVPEAPSPTSTVDLRSRMRSGLLVQRVATWGGDFDTRTYTAVKDGAGTDVGVDIQLEFKPGKMVESSHIGMVQMVNSKDLGVPLPLNATVKGRSIGKGADVGAHVDQLQDFRNPIYYTQKGKKGDRLSSTKSIGDMAGGGRPGWRHKDAKTGKISTRSARLNDTPQLPGRGANASQVFESTAVALEGKQRGTYYGSVEWGWRTDAAGTFSIIPLAKKQDDAPSDSFREATGLWNASKTSTGGNVVKLGTAEGRFVTADHVKLFNGPTANASRRELDKNTRVQTTDSKGARSKVTVIDGAGASEVGWVLTANLAAAKVP